MGYRRLFAAITLVASLGISSALSAQQKKAPTLDEILTRLEANLNHYDTSLPSLFCDEHVASVIEPSQGDRDTITDSIFRLKRTENPNHTESLVESREIKTVNGKPATSQDIKGPTLLSGAFEGGFAVVSSSQRACMKYRLERIHGDSPDEPYIVDFATAITPENKAACLLQEKGKGRVFIDLASMEIKRLELTTPRHVIIPGNAYARAVIGKWFVTVDYAPVVLDAETFWMPAKITSEDDSTSEGFHATTWVFVATYQNYHRLEVRSRILPGSEPVQ